MPFGIPLPLSSESEGTQPQFLLFKKRELSRNEIRRAIPDHKTPFTCLLSIQKSSQLKSPANPFIESWQEASVPNPPPTASDPATTSRSLLLTYSANSLDNLSTFIHVQVACPAAPQICRQVHVKATKGFLCAAHTNYPNSRIEARFPY